MNKTQPATGRWLRPGWWCQQPGKSQAPGADWGRRTSTAKGQIWAKVEHPFRVIKQQIGFQKTRLRGMAKNHCKVTAKSLQSQCSGSAHESVSISYLSTGDGISAQMVCLLGKIWHQNRQKLSLNLGKTKCGFWTKSSQNLPLSIFYA